MNLCGWLRTLGASETASHERNRSAEAIYADLRKWAAAYVRRTSPCPLTDDDVDEAIQHVLMRAATGTCRFQGDTEGEAFSWCMRVLLNRARDRCREKRRFHLISGSDREFGPDVTGPEPETQADHEALALHEFQDILAEIEAALVRLHRAQDVEGLTLALRCHLEARLGASPEEQVARFSPDGRLPADAEAAVRARNRIYQYRNRGRRAGCEALAALVAEGRYSAEDVEHAAQLLGCHAFGPTPVQRVPGAS
jgi:DNA-directed RNA polymerase specialized sigma24 family protein